MPAVALGRPPPPHPLQGPCREGHWLRPTTPRGWAPVQQHLAILAPKIHTTEPWARALALSSVRWGCHRFVPQPAHRDVICLGEGAGSLLGSTEGWGLEVEAPAFGSAGPPQAHLSPAARAQPRPQLCGPLACHTLLRSGRCRTRQGGRGSGLWHIQNSSTQPSPQDLGLGCLAVMAQVGQAWALVPTPHGLSHLGQRVSSQ